MNKSYQIGLWILISVVPFLIFIQKLYGIVFMLLFGCLTILTMGIFYDLKRSKIKRWVELLILLLWMGCCLCFFTQLYDDAVKKGKVTEKESKLWKFVLSFYGTEEFSTKQLEKDFGDAAYATIRGFVSKFEKLGLLSSAKYGARVKYKVVK